MLSGLGEGVTSKLVAEAGLSSSSLKLLVWLLSSDLGGGADSVTFFGLVRVVGGCLLMVETSEWSVTGSSSGMAGSGGKWPLNV